MPESPHQTGPLSEGMPRAVYTKSSVVAAASIWRDGEACSTRPRQREGDSSLPESPLVSVGLPVYNGERFLRQSLESVLAQTYENFELIISDNASTDGTDAICREFAARDTRIRYVRNSRNMGAAYNFDKVVELARGELFRLHTHDDIMAPPLLERCVSVLMQEPDAVLCHPEMIRIDEEDREIDRAAGTLTRALRVPSSATETTMRWPTVR